MSDRFTEAYTPDFQHGFASRGRLTRAEAIQAFREHFEHVRADADAALAVPDEDLVVETYLGLHTRRRREDVKE